MHLLTRYRHWADARRVRRITLEQARRRAGRGAAYLDDVAPGWCGRIDPATLELSDGTCCVLGQLHGDFRLGLGRAAIVHPSSAPRANLSPVDLGFLCVQGVAAPWQAQDYAYLDRAWKEEVVRRLPPERRTPAGRSAERPAPVLAG